MLLRHSGNLSKTLQIKDISATEGQHVAAMVKVTLQSICNESSFSGFWQVVTAKSQKLSVSNPSLPRRRKKPMCYSNGETESEFHSWALDLIIQFLADCFDQPGYIVCSTLEQLLLKAYKGETHEEEINFVMELCHHNIHPDNFEL